MNQTSTVVVILYNLQEMYFVDPNLIHKEIIYTKKKKWWKIYLKFCLDNYGWEWKIKYVGVKGVGMTVRNKWS